MVETRHVKLNHEEALSAKKQLLSSELNILNIVKKIKTYRRLRKRELTAKNNFKTNLSSLRTKIDTIYHSFPEQKEELRIPKKSEKNIVEKNLQKELEEIKEKLAKLR